MKCLPASKVPLANGRCLHDWHAEIVSIRAFNLFLIDECASLGYDPALASPWIRRRTSEEKSSNSAEPFAIKDDVHIDMYCSNAPCGDSSMELVMDSQDDATPWLPTEADHSISPVLNGRGHFSELGTVRRKPARADAPETKSKSCSDKLALKQTTSLLSSISSLLVHPGNAYLRNLVLPYSRYYHASFERAFGCRGRMAPLTLQGGKTMSWAGGYSFRPFSVRLTTKEFPFSRAGIGQVQSRSASNIAAVWTPNYSEVLVGGTIQGHKQFSVRGGSVICRARTWKSAMAVAQAETIPGLVEVLGQSSYSLVKQNSRLNQRSKVKEQVKAQALQGWVANDGDDAFTL